MDFGFTPIAQDAISQALRLRWLSAESAGVASAWDGNSLARMAFPADQSRNSPVERRRATGWSMALARLE